MDDNLPLVSAVITTHNRAELLGRAIESVLKQTYPHIECIVVDDNSTDATAQICARFSNVKYIHIPAAKSHGGNYARNLGIQEAKGKYVAFLDDDDCWMPDKITKQICALKQQKCGIAFCGRRREFVNKLGIISYQDQLPNPLFHGDVSKLIFSSIPATTSTLIIQRDLLLQVDGFDEQLNFWQEYDLMVRLAQVSTFAQVSENLILYRIDVADSQRLSTKYEPWLEAVRYFERKHSSYISNLSLGEYLRHRKLIADDALLRLQSSSKKWTRTIIRTKYLFLVMLCKTFKS